MTNLQINDQINDQHRCSVDNVTEGSGPAMGPLSQLPPAVPRQDQAGASLGVYSPQLYSLQSIGVGFRLSFDADLSAAVGFVLLVLNSLD